MTHLERLAKSYGVTNFFDYIIEKQYIGAISYVRELFFKMRIKDRYAFIAYAMDNGEYGRKAVENILKNL